MGLSIRGEDQKVGCTGAPTNAILAPIKARSSEEKEDSRELTFVYEVKKKKKVLCECVHTCRPSLYLAHSSLDDGIKASLRGISVPGYHLLLHLLCEAAHFLC